MKSDMEESKVHIALPSLQTPIIVASSPKTLKQESRHRTNPSKKHKLSKLVKDYHKQWSKSVGTQTRLENEEKPPSNTPRSKSVLRIRLPSPQQEIVPVLDKNYPEDVFRCLGTTFFTTSRRVFRFSTEPKDVGRHRSVGRASRVRRDNRQERELRKPAADFRIRKSQLRRLDVTPLRLQQLQSSLSLEEDSP
mmetsp:Transcript_34957/g.39648  ORF Transcript_34957/g.39648 Transcript_34957/m.39648 type:complete len:193 (+) Transcript_34957:47-625(+)